MTAQEIERLLEKQREFYRSGATIPVAFRVERLKALRRAIRQFEAEIAAALLSDLGKSAYEAYMCEIGLALSEISHMIRNVKKWAKPRRVWTPLAQFPSRSYIQAVPRGCVLIMSPWNYPFLLTIGPLVDAIAAGNVAIAKPSAYSPATSAVVAKLIAATFTPEYVATVDGGRAENAALLDQKFDFIFFTGGQTVGKEVLRRAAERLTPVALELGGKSPCVVDSTANIKVAAKRIVFGKYLNCGQTCVAPDYILCERSIKAAFVAEVVKEIKRQYGDNPLEDKDYGKIVNAKHFERLCGLIVPEKVVCGGVWDATSQRIAPTVMDGVVEADAVMGEEIFGPIMPILTFDDFDAAVDALKTKDKPLALYLFSNDKRRVKRVVSELTYGGGCVNDVVIHLATTEMGFGGVGESGMGAYHGKVGFDAFSHLKSVVDKATWLDLPMRYRPYTNKLYEAALRMFLR